MRTSDPHLGARMSPLAVSSSGKMLNSVAAAEPSPAASPHPAWIEERARVAVERNVNVTGRLVFHEPIRIDGRFRGEVTSSELVVISEDGSMGGRIRTPRLVVLGELEGEVSASKSVVLGPRSRFKGSIEADNLRICEGASFNGELRIGRREADRSAPAEPPSPEQPQTSLAPHPPESLTADNKNGQRGK
jgi:cytoskeletal protein CcmA (bactofilin family)